MSERKSTVFLWGLLIIAVWLLLLQQLFAQTQEAVVPIEQEPRHRIVFQNKNVRIIDCLVLPGDLTFFHRHSFDYVSIVVSGGNGTGQIQGKPPMQFAATNGQVTFNKAKNASYTHRVGNVGTTPLRFIGVEVLASAASKGAPATLDNIPGHKFVLGNDAMKIYRVSIDPKESTGIRSRTLPWLRVSITQGTISVQGSGKSPETIETKAGDYRWHEGATTDSIQNIGSTKYEAIEIEWK